MKMLVMITAINHESKNDAEYTYGWAIKIQCRIVHLKVMDKADIATFVPFLSRRTRQEGEV